ncbi:hypothetical protein V3C99_000991 [Haemonchus contortus]
MISDEVPDTEVFKFFIELFTARLLELIRRAVPWVVSVLTPLFDVQTISAAKLQQKELVCRHRRSIQLCAINDRLLVFPLAILKSSDLSIRVGQLKMLQNIDCFD